DRWIEIENHKVKLLLLARYKIVSDYLTAKFVVTAPLNTTDSRVAKYSGTDRVDLIENNEYGFCSLIKATKRVIDKIELENRTMSQITPRERIDTRLWNQVALREAIINAIVHNDYTREVPPKFEIFSDRIEMTSYGTLIDGLEREDFFAGKI